MGLHDYICSIAKNDSDLYIYEPLIDEKEEEEDEPDTPNPGSDTAAIFIIPEGDTVRVKDLHKYPFKLENYNWSTWYFDSYPGVETAGKDSEEYLFRTDKHPGKVCLIVSEFALACFVNKTVDVGLIPTKYLKWVLENNSIPFEETTEKNMHSRATKKGMYSKIRKMTLYEP